MAGTVVRNSNLEFYRTRAAQARAEADDATLDHVRERCRRSEVAWTALADRAARSEQLKIAEAQRKAEQSPGPEETPLEGSEGSSPAADRPL